MRLFVFPHSHYCEKARWALDFKGIPFEAVVIMPGVHMVTVRRHAPKTSVPVLLNGGEVVQGSSEIIDYLEQKYPFNLLTPLEVDQRTACLEIENSMDDRLGENIRRILYYSLLAYPDYIRHCFTYSMPRAKKIFFSLLYPLLRKKIYQTYVISPAMVEKSRCDFDDAMTELEKELRGKQYLVGGQFTRADLSIASMLSLLVLPPEHPLPWGEIPDSEARSFYEEYLEHPVSLWVREMYRNHRLCGGNSSQ